MRKSLILFVMAVGGSVSYGAGITEFGRDTGTADSSTWRWHVNSILAEQQRAAYLSWSRQRPTSKPF
jgi:hypothetical protein